MTSNYPALFDYVLEGNPYGPLLDSLDLEKHRGEWRQLFRRLITCPPLNDAISERFHTKWHVSHHYIRELIADDALLTDMLWVWLPRYSGPGLLLYRGENIDRFERGAIGSAWTDQKETARMFASGLNAEGKGGVILQVQAPAEAIIAGPSKHSDWLGESEFTVDWRSLGKIEQLHQFKKNLYKNKLSVAKI